MDDIFDGQIFKEKIEQNVIQKGDIIFLYHTDGITVFKNPPYTMWPDYLQILNFPPQVFHSFIPYLIILKVLLKFILMN